MKSLKEQWIDAIKKKQYNMSTCMCGYQCHYFYTNDQLYYDNGCYCTRSSGDNSHPREESDLDFYLDTNNGHINSIKTFVKETNL